MLNLGTRLRKCLTLAIIFCVFQPAVHVMADDIPAQTEQPPLTKTGGLEMAYFYTFDVDKCGESELGRTYRKAIVAKLESCPFTQETKQQFYKDTGAYASSGLSEILSFVATHSSEEAAQHIRESFKDAHCEAADEQQSIRIMHDKLSEYKSGKIGLTDILISVKSGEHLKLGAPITCEQFSKEGYPDSSSAANGSVNRGSSGTPSGLNKKD
jgi:hypothetical protein